VDLGLLKGCGKQLGGPAKVPAVGEINVKKFFSRGEVTGLAFCRIAQPDDSRRRCQEGKSGYRVKED